MRKAVRPWGRGAVGRSRAIDPNLVLTVVVIATAFRSASTICGEKGGKELRKVT